MKNAHIFGWAATGANGVLASMMSAYAAADTMSRDVLPDYPQPDLDAVPVEELRREDHAMGVDEEEIRRGREAELGGMRLFLEIRTPSRQ